LRIGFLYPQQIIWNKGRTVLTRTHYWYQHEPCWYVRKKNAPWFGKAWRELDGLAVASTAPRSKYTGTRGTVRTISQIIWSGWGRQFWRQAGIRVSVAAARPPVVSQVRLSTALIHADVNRVVDALSAATTTKPLWQPWP
jgi:hypothetical protein